MSPRLAIWRRTVIASQAPPIVQLPTNRAPHVRDSINLDGIGNRLILALLPSLTIGIVNTGYQANLALWRSGLEEPPDWRARLLAAVGLGFDPSNVFDSLGHGLLYFLPLFLVTLAVACIWRQVFATLRGRPAAESCLPTVLVFTLLLPPPAPLWQAALGISFGVIFAKEVFGGTGKNFVHPSLAGLVFLYFSYPGVISTGPLWRQLSGYGGTNLFADIQAGGVQTLDAMGPTWWDSWLGLTQGPLGATSALAATLGAALLLAWRTASWRIIAGILGGLIATLSCFQFLSSSAAPLLALPWYWHATLGSFAFAAVFLATDPVCSPMTQRGAWVYGLLIGFMTVLIRWKNPLHPDGVLLAILLGSIFAPLIDSLVIWSNVRERRRRVN